MGERPVDSSPADLHSWSRSPATSIRKRSAKCGHTLPPAKRISAHDIMAWTGRPGKGAQHEAGAGVSPRRTPGFPQHLLATTVWQLVPA